MPSFLLYLEKRLQKRFPQQQATWTRGPSLPRLRPEDTARTRVTVFISRVHLPRYPLMMKPLRMVLICSKPPSSSGLVLDQNKVHNFIRHLPLGFLNHKRTEQRLALVTRPGRRKAVPTEYTGSSSVDKALPPIDRKSQQHKDFFSSSKLHFYSLKP